MSKAKQFHVSDLDSETYDWIQKKKKQYTHEKLFGKDCCNPTFLRLLKLELEERTENAKA